MIVFAKPLGLRAQWAGLLLALTMLGMALAVSLALMRAHLLRVEEARLAAQASTIEANLQRQLQGVNAALAAVAHDLKGLGHRPDVPAALTRQLEALSEAMPGVRTMLVLNAAGRVLASTRADLIGQDLSEREYVQVAAQSLSPDELYLSSPFRTVFGLFTMVLVRVVHDEHGKTHRIVAASLAPDFSRCCWHRCCTTMTSGRRWHTRTGC